MNHCQNSKSYESDLGHTHIPVVELDDPQLSDALRDIISDGSNALFLSTASAWEIAIKAGLGRLTLPEPPGKFIANRLTLHRFQPLAVQLSHAAHVYNLPDHHRDPFDRLLIAQGQLEDMAILTVDQVAEGSTPFWHPNK